MNIYHNSRLIEYRKPFGAAQVSSEVKLAIRVAAEGQEQVSGVFVRTWQDDIGEVLTEMSGQGSMYRATLKMPDEGGLLWYFFVIKLEDGRTLYYGNNPRKTGGEGIVSENQPESFQITVYRHQPVPEWFKSGTVYQIFPDRFARDEGWKERCLSAGRDIEENWYKPASYEKDERGHVKTWSFYGGSLVGIMQRLDYLKSLGISVIYLNPIFKARSNHRYDTANYMLIDPALGTEDEFRSLCAEAKKKGIRIILDGVFSHVGADSIYFDRYGHYGGIGAYNNPDSIYRDWFEFRENDPVGYRSWWGVEDLPEVNEDQEGFIDLICGEEGVLAKWLRAGASGFRLDVADELPDEFIQKIRTRLKAEDPDNLLMGEVWEDASNKISYGSRRKYFMGDELDSTMHYPLRDGLMDFALFRKSGSEVSDSLMALVENYPKENLYGAMNLIGSHDRERILTAMGADDNYDIAAARVKMLTALQFALPGVPCIYYGDEAGMTGGNDPQNRSGFIWNKENTELQGYFRQLGVIYGDHPVLKDGAVKFLETGNADLMAFVRTNSDEKILVVANRGEATEYEAELDEYNLDLLTSTVLPADEKISMPPRSIRIIHMDSAKPDSFDLGRKAGVIAHISSIPGRTLGAASRSFVDYLASAGMSLWQVLPLNPPGLGDSPYSSYGVFAGDPGLIDKNEIPDDSGYDKFVSENSEWLEPFALYVTARECGNDYDDAVRQRVFREQYNFYVQWKQLRDYANAKGVSIVGDLPIFVSADSADIWADRQNFRISEDGIMEVHAGVPADYFSPEGQNWGNPLYDWDSMKADDYSWWIRRLKQAAARYDYVRLDHFRSFSEYFAIPEGKTPLEGIWQHGPGLDFFRKVQEEIGDELRIIAEDLGQLDIGVWNLLKLSGLPGMNVWQFSGDEMMAMSPEEAANRIFYTGTHDNQTLVSWCEDFGLKRSDALSIIRQLYESPAPWVMIQLQDMLMLDDSCRMNVPGVAEGNWQWHLEGTSMEDSVENSDRIAAGFKTLASETGRLRDSRLEDFMVRHKLAYNPEDLPEMVNNFVDYYKNEIAAGRIGGVAGRVDSEDRTVLAIDCGGTHTRIAKVNISGTDVQIGKRARTKTIGKEHLVTADEFFDSLANLVKSVDSGQTCDRIGFGFSFPGNSVSDGLPDVEIIKWDKEINVAGGIGRRAGQLLGEALERQGFTGKAISTANDTITTIMAGRLISGEDKPCIAGVVLGTGSNICFLDKETGLIYNLECGGYPDFPSGDIDDAIDQASNDIGGQLAEKMMSGAYRSVLVKAAAAFAIKEGVMDKEISRVDDKIRLKAIEKAIVDRAAAYEAVSIAAAVTLAGFGPGRYNVMAEGSVFWKVEGFAQKVKGLTNRLLAKDGIRVDFIRTGDAGIVGAAALA